MQLQFILIIYSNFLACCSVYESVNDSSCCFPPSFSACLSFATCYSVSELLVCRTCFSYSLVWKDKKEWVGRGWCGCLGGIFGTLPHFIFINNNFPYLLLSFQAHSSRTTFILLYLKREEVLSEALTVESVCLSVSQQKVVLSFCQTWLLVKLFLLFLNIDVRFYFLVRLSSLSRFFFQMTNYFN